MVARGSAPARRAARRRAGAVARQRPTVQQEAWDASSVWEDGHSSGAQWGACGSPHAAGKKAREAHLGSGVKQCPAFSRHTSQLSAAN